MLRDELLAKMIAKDGADRNFNGWADVLTVFADCLAPISPRLSRDECDKLVDVGVGFYRTLARAEQYRRTSVRGDGVGAEG